ncbi:MAG: sodium ion-translocating decarboxylase subunit beta [Victivallales bacterium]|jgi:oxaloacetate decarboxylase beta subunit|nr:sodium ion-translocating decarboxylase subunit beta [Victivallales bacterium]
MGKVKLFSAICLGLFAGMIMAAPEPTVSVSAPTSKQTIKCEVKEVKLEVPANALKLETSSDDLFSWYIDPATQLRYMVYDWEKPAVVNSLTVAVNQKVTPGREMMVVVPEGRSKGKVKIDMAAKVVKLNPNFIPSSSVKKGTVIAVFQPIELAHDSVGNATVGGGDLPGWGEAFQGLWKSTGIYDIIRQTTSDFKSTWILGLGRVLMMLVALLLIYLAIVKEFEPLLLLPIGFGALLANIPLAGIAGPDGLQGMVFEVGINSGVFPLLIFMGVGAMTDFGPLLANPKTALLGGAAQFGIFTALLGALVLTIWIPAINFSILDAASIGIIGGADGPTSIYLTSKLSPKLLGAVAVAAYSYMALVPIIQPPIMKLLTTKEERKIQMKQLRTVSKIEKICFPLMITLLCAFLLPDAAPLIGMLMLGNLMRECGVVERLNQTAQNALINIVTIFLGIAVGSKLSADQFLSVQTLGILFLGAVAFSIGTAAGVIFAKIMNFFSKDPINPLIGSAGVSAVPMAARVSNKVGLEANPQNFLLMHAMGPNVAGVIGSAVAAGVLLNVLKHLI